MQLTKHPEKISGVQYRRVKYLLNPFKEFFWVVKFHSSNQFVAELRVSAEVCFYCKIHLFLMNWLNSFFLGEIIMTSHSNSGNGLCCARIDLSDFLKIRETKVFFDLVVWVCKKLCTWYLLKLAPLWIWLPIFSEYVVMISLPLFWKKNVVEQCFHLVIE